MAKRKFHSNDFLYRPTGMAMGLAAAMADAGMEVGMCMVREPKQSITATNKEGTKWQKERMIPVRSAA